ncbi:MAG: hypothetical protein JOZ98_15785 [Solirubrobacterales bacterium]|nr:hypothetical protein [Solirubrobacterales bacterium]
MTISRHERPERRCRSGLNCGLNVDLQHPRPDRRGDRSRTVGVDEQNAALLLRSLNRRRGLQVGARA